MTADPNRKLKVFLCHSSHDKPAVREIYTRLKAEGWIDPWLDEEKLFPGQDWDLEIEKAVEETDAVLVFLSDNSVNKEGYIQKELRFVLNMAEYKPEGTTFILPLRLNECPLPRRLRSWHYVDNFPDDRKEWAYGRLLSSLKLRAKKLGIHVTTTPEEKVAKNKLTEKLKHSQKDTNLVDDLFEAAMQESQEIASVPLKDYKRASGRILREKRNEKIKKFFSKNGKRLSLIGGGLVLLFLLGYIISNIEISATPEPTKTPTASPATATRVLPTSTSLPTSTPLPEKTSAPTEIPATPTPELGVGSTMISSKDGMTLLYVPAGEFKMGSEDYDDSKPVHTVYLDAFWIDQTEVTNGMYAQCVEAGVCNPPNESKSYTRASYYGNAEFDNYPVIYVSWEDANTYCTWAERRLPTEAEWEKAARGTDGRIYPWGDIFDDSITNLCDINCPLNWKNADFNDGYQDTSPAGHYVAGAGFYGAFDMAGNVWEWIADWYDESYYASSPASNPFGPDTGDLRVWRGGSWTSGNNNDLRVANRSRGNLTNAHNFVGFRCSRSAVAP